MVPLDLVRLLRRRRAHTFAERGIGPPLDPDAADLFETLLDEETATPRMVLTSQVYDAGRFAEAIRLFSDMTLSERLEGSALRHS